MNDLSLRSRIDPATIQALLDAGIEFVLQFDGPYGGGDYADLGTVTQVMHLLDYGEEYCASRHYGFTDIATYREWLETRSIPLCGAINSRGGRCRQYISPRSHLYSPDEWRELHRVGRCTYHRKG